MPPYNAPRVFLSVVREHLAKLLEREAREAVQTSFLILTVASARGLFALEIIINRFNGF